MAITKVTSGGIKDSAITSAKIADGTIANTDISTTAAIPSSKLDHGTSRNKMVRLDNSGRMPAIDGSNITNLDATALVGALPAIDGSGLLNVTTDITGKVDKVSWSHAAGTVGTFNEDASIGTIAIGAVSGIDGSAMTASNTTSLPAGCSLSSGGSLTGTLTNLTSNTTTSFTVSVTDGTNTDTRTFSITNTADNDAPTWNTDAGALADTTGSGYSVQLSASDAEGEAITYSMASGTIPAGLSLSSSGLISGTATNLDGTNHSFTVTVTDASGTTADRSFTIMDKVPPPTFYNSSTGGTISTYSDGGTDYKVHTFTTSGTFVAGGDGTADIMIIGGGGGSGEEYAGGSGAGGMVYKQNEAFSAGNYTVVVGAGSVNQGEGRPGSDTDFKGLEAIGGGGSSRDFGGIAAGYNYESMSEGGCGSGKYHGSGGGGAYQRSRAGDSGTYGFGFDADNGSWGSHGGGGGGGIGAVGGNPTSKGGDGLQEGTSITYSDSSTVTFGFDGTGDWYGIGGSGGKWRSCAGSTAPNNGGAACGSSGAANTGNGGGAGGQGGSGICIIRYAV
jgi:hypothetical protein